MKKSVANQGSSVITCAAAVAAALGLGGTCLTVPQAIAQQAGDQSNELSEILVTGSRIVRRDLDAPSPITTVDSTAFERISTISIESALNRLPQFRPAGTQFDTMSFSATATSSPGLASANLRGLGANRTLVLVDGRRAQPSNATLAVDVNTIPAAAIRSVEVITGGASAVYGADATAGVVNFVLRDDYEGLEFGGQTGVTEVGDGGETRLSAVIGRNFGGGEGNVLLGLEFSRRSGAHYMGRDFYEDGWRDPGTVGFGLINQAGYSAGANVPDQAVIDGLFPDQAPGTVSPANTFYFNTDGTPWQSQGAANFKGPFNLSMKIGPGGNVNQSFLDRLASQPMERYSAFGTANFTVNEHVTAYLQGTFSSSTVDTVGYYAPAITIWSASIPYRPENPVPAGLAALLDARPDSTADWTLFRQFDFWGPMRATTKTSVHQILAGLTGTLPIADWTWDAHVSSGSTDATVSVHHLPSYQRYQQLVAAPGYGAGFNMTGPYGQGITCTTGLEIFPGTPTSQDCFDAIETNLQQTTAHEQNIAEATLQGRAFNMPAGEARFAFGLAYRSNDFDFNPGSLNAANSVVEHPIGVFAVSSASGRTTVSEAYGEMLLPLLSGLPMAQRLDLELGYRTSKYNLAGTVGTYKSLLSWAPVDRLLVRGGYQRANRAPNVAELFQGGTVNTVTFATGDPCAIDTVAPWGNVPSNPDRVQVQELCRAIIGNSTSGFDNRPGGADAYVGPFGFFTGENVIVSGNRNLDSEDASTWTAGFVLRWPSEGDALRNLSLAVDYYNIEITEAIAPTDAVTVYAKCFNADGSNPTYALNDPGGFCSLIRRDAFSGDRQSVNTPFINTGGIKTSGTDVQVNWRAAFADMGLQRIPGELSADVIVTLLSSFQTKATDTAEYLESRGTLNQNGQFRWRSYTTINYLHGAWGAGLTWTHLPSAAAAQSVQNPATTVLGVPSYDLFGLNAFWDVGPAISLRAGIDNVFDKEPPVVGANPGVNNAMGSTSPGFYDVLGRRYFVGARFQF